MGADAMCRRRILEDAISLLLTPLVDEEHFLSTANYLSLHCNLWGHHQRSSCLAAAKMSRLTDHSRCSFGP